MPADGDSGAPVFLEVTGKWELAGMVSRKLAIGNFQSLAVAVTDR